MTALRLIRVPCAGGVRVDLVRDGVMLQSGWSEDLPEAVRALRRIRRKALLTQKRRAAPNPAEVYSGWCAANGFAPGAHDSLVAWLRTLVLPTTQRVLTADHVCRQLFPDRAAGLLIALECAGCFD